MSTSILANSSRRVDLWSYTIRTNSDSVRLLATGVRQGDDALHRLDLCMPP